jgi:large subunit ribosomal protein L24
MVNRLRQNKQIKKGDKVYIIAGNDKGMTGTVLSRTEDTVTVQGVNVCKRHMKKSAQHPQGGIVELEKAIDLSNVAPWREDGKK